jgi:glycosyltransferase involved in cell wall biosynthesis
MGEPTKAEPLRILMALPELKFGGVETVVTDLAAGMTARGHRVAVMSMGGRMVENVTASGAEHIALPVHSKNLFTFLLCQPRVERAIKDFGASVLHAHSRVPAWHLYIASRKLGIPFVTTCHSQYGIKLTSSVMAKGDVVTCDSAFVRDYIIKGFKANPDKFAVIYNGIVTSKYNVADRAGNRAAYLADLKLPDDALVVGGVGRFVAHKRFDAFVRIAARVAAKNAQAYFVLVGDGPDLPAVRELADSLGIGSRVRFTGYRSDVPKLMPFFDVFLMTSDREGLCYVNLEALSAGVPVVSSHIGPIPEYLSDGAGGYLVEPTDEDGYAKAVLKLLDDADLRAGLGQAARETARRMFEMGMIFDRYEEAYRRAIALRRG